MNGSWLQAILTVIALVSFLFTVAAAYVSNQMGIARLAGENTEIYRRQEEMRKDISNLRDMVARLQERGERGQH